MKTSMRKHGTTKTKSDELVRYKNKINGIVYHAFKNQKSVVREGVEYLPVFEHLHRPRTVYVAKSVLEKLSN